MQISVSVNVPWEDREDWTLSADEAADAVLKALGGDEGRDHCVVYINTLIPQGSAGTPPPPEPPA